MGFLELSTLSHPGMYVSEGRNKITVSRKCMC